MANEPLDDEICPRIITKHGELESLFPEIPIGLNSSKVSHVGARTSRDYASGPGVNLDKNGRIKSFSTGRKSGSIFDGLDLARCANSYPEITGGSCMDVSMGHESVLHEAIRHECIRQKDKHFHDDTYNTPDFSRIPRRGSRESRSKSAKTKKAPKTRSLSPNQKFRGVGKPKISVLRGMYPLHVRGVTETSGYDKDMYAGVVRIDFRGRLDPLDAMGINVAKSVQKMGEEGGTMIIPGRVVGQKHLKGRNTGVTYRAVFLDGHEDTFDEIMLRHYAGMFSSACMKTEDPLLPLIVRMM